VGGAGKGKALGTRLINLPPIMSNENKNISGPLVLDLRK